MRTRRDSRRAELSPSDARALLKERIYGAFSCLTSLLVLAGHVAQPADHQAVWRALLDVVLTLSSLWLASLFAEFLAHLVSHDRVTAHDWVHMARSTWQIMAAGIPSVFALLLCRAGLWELPTALWVSIGLVIASLGLFAWLAVRRTSLGPFTRFVMMAVLVAIGCVVVGLKLLAH